MGSISFILANGVATTVEFQAGSTIVQVAVGNSIDGIEATCGGSCSCATCHVYVNDAWLSKLPPVTPDENDLLDGTASERLPNSRLSCQVKLTDALDGIVVTLPDRQS